MCGRYNLSTPPQMIAKYFGAVTAPLWEPSDNVCPTQTVPVLRASREAGSEKPVRRLDLLRWGLVPHWADDLSVARRTINARAETVAVKPAFRKSFCSQRCAIPADGFYEWKTIGKKKQPFHIGRADGQPIAFAGLWDRWDRGEAPIESFTIITRDATPALRDIHDRMPVILQDDDAIDTWLDPSRTAPEQLEPFLKSAPADEWFAIRPK